MKSTIAVFLDIAKIADFSKTQGACHVIHLAFGSL